MRTKSTENYGQIMLKCRLGLGLTQQELADKLGYGDFRTVLRKEKGKLGVSSVELLALRYLMHESNLLFPELSKPNTVAS